MFRLHSRTISYAFLICALALTLPGSVAGDMQLGVDLTVVWIRFESQAELARLASRLDIWEVHHEQDTVTAMISPEDAEWLANSGFDTILHIESVQHANTIPGYTCYRTIDEQYTLLDSWSQLFPQLAQTITIGHSYEGRELRVLKLTNTLTSGTKPVFFLMANIHGRELITNETALAFAQHLLEFYSIDPDITWLLDQHVIYVLVSGNPDGHVKNEPGQPWTWWRKNTQPYGDCGELLYGVDLNRNASFMWGNASLNPCDSLYQGPESASEPETVVIADFIRSIISDRRGPGSSDPAPADTTGIFITLHSYGNLILWPWSHTYDIAPNAAQLAMLGTKLAYFNGYKARAAANLYPASGTTLDFVYGELGAASFLFELGTGADGFYPDCTRYKSIVEPNIQALLYAAKVARSPYEISFGPDVVGLTLIPSYVTVGTSAIISATVDDTQNGNQVISEVEVILDTPPWEADVSAALTATDGLFDTPSESVTGLIDTQQLTAGQHLVFLRGMDNAGYWGPISATFLDVVSPTFDLEPQQAYGYASPDSVLTYTLSITNTSSLTQTYWMTGSLPEWETHFTPPPLILGPQHRSALTLTVAIPFLEALPLNQYADQVTLTVSTLTTPLLSHAAYFTTRVLRGSTYIPLMIRDD